MKRIRKFTPLLLVAGAFLILSCEESDLFTEEDSQGIFFREDAPFFVQFAIPVESYVELSILDEAGTVVLSVLDDTLDAGTYEYSWSATEDMDDGIYALYLAAAGWTDERVFELDTRNISGQMISFASAFFDESIYRETEYNAGVLGGFGGLQNEWEALTWEERLTYLELEIVQETFGIAFKHDLPLVGNDVFYSYIGTYTDQFGFAWDDWTGSGSAHLNLYQTMIGGASGWYE